MGKGYDVRTAAVYAGAFPPGRGDGEVTLKDCVQITRYLAGGWEIVLDLANADVNGDGKADLKDVVLLRRYLAGWDVTLQKQV